ncbi:lysophospholipid acyltransferase family protein [Mucilaginibacter dorajii]|uniref:Phospholipid/glycerol acyltransferase domain-containing protein n=1 Tax=Mucilaginibacter dorajii TaxID=692994 RepID=A0ABP7P857_9SPHI|nr:lysophospholipid acyltransferase family protein [Mucilaginibacter dorajii]MCS3735310.1 putative hemolysin [Mucilaginibacter dorajii]
MDLISKNDIIKATGIKRLPGLATLLMKLIKIDAFNDMMRQAGILKGVDFTAYALNFLGIRLEVHPDDLANIPAAGAFIAVANHPYGAVESLALLNLLVSQRSDTLFMGNFLLKRVPNLADYIIAVNPFDNIKDSSSISGIKNTLGKLKSGTPVAIFPAGEVSAFNFKTQKITDREWHPVVGKIIAKAGVPVLPVYFHGDNGIGFSLLRYIHPALQTAMLPAELFNKKGLVLRVRIGKPISPCNFNAQQKCEELLPALRAITYALKEEAA